MQQELFVEHYWEENVLDCAICAHKLKNVLVFAKKITGEIFLIKNFFLKIKVKLILNLTLEIKMKILNQNENYKSA